MMKLLQSCSIAFSMYSRIPMPRTEWNQENMKYAMCFFPLVGVVIGGIVFFVSKILLYFNVSDLFYSVTLTLLPVIVTGGIHMDGFMDTSDALGSYGSREKKLEILKDRSFLCSGGNASVCWDTAGGTWNHRYRKL